MRIIEAEAQVIADLKDEGRVVTERSFPAFTVITVRHPTLGKLVLVQMPDGRGAMVEVEE
ncbi:hypothetical protein CKO31_21390 [Thiohalocapsa halophila]|uniref:DUF4926 domain-containing protein n=1 Tax=Thiohalocapsa halophila TaxID=69359 RepID=A0ABS1CMU5_9GAMM|nr:hypothetical protein [Thiohalocapsa halophila]MBK1633259.1 hypothetical protein [Thiohalocapsa halophila]